ncbi:hypothetical protein A3B60_01420 [Candidatus Peregrinibacteria bacterium RIFCSPLOWO2_01_FULL_39_12]|nr:MAG: hypothetical protein A3B60_01420 [Candidatus Peregrinibacteria bacterium RIFCSPLOWO2_01_FULL_39_12]OGJ42112.1 MAG: hypothetical protein A3I58_00505 [Candidatus Peregrinibacteria bacterium RIFCSPLOWO2_02_FULL_39_10]
MKYNWSIIGHEKQLRQIEKDLLAGNLAHAYLLAGTNSVGKYTVAKKMAGILQCENDFCHSCNTCLQIQKGSHIDTMEMSDDRESIKIEEVRKLIDRLNMTKQSPYKVVLIQTLERMTTEAANSFLKILEEPPSRTIFIMTTNNVRILLPTVLSRVRIVKFGCVSYEYLVEKLTELYPNCDAEVIKQVSLFSLGKTGRAVRLMENLDVRAEYMKTYQNVQNFLGHKNVVDRFSYIEDVVEDPAQIEIFFNILTSVLRSKIIGGDDASNKYIKTLSKIDEAGMLLTKNVNARLVLENLMLSL